MHVNAKQVGNKQHIFQCAALCLGFVVGSDVGCLANIIEPPFERKYRGRHLDGPRRPIESSPNCFSTVNDTLVILCLAAGTDVNMPVCRFMAFELVLLPTGCIQGCFPLESSDQAQGIAELESLALLPLCITSLIKLAEATG